MSKKTKRRSRLIRVSGRTEICRSFTYKLNMGNYESRDFFMSQKAECDAEDMETISEALHEFCKTQVLKSVQRYRDELAEQVRIAKELVTEAR